MWLVELFKAVFNNLNPTGNVILLPFLAGMLQSLGNSLYTVHRMLRRKNIGETTMALIIPYVLFGSLFIMEPLVTASLFAMTDLLPFFNFIIGQMSLYLEILILGAVFAISTWLFSATAMRRMGGTLSMQTFRNCGLEVALSIMLVVISVMALFQQAPAFLITDLGLKVFIYAIFTVAIKTAVNLFLVIYTCLFRSRDEKRPEDDRVSGQQGMAESAPFYPQESGIYDHPAWTFSTTVWLCCH